MERTKPTKEILADCFYQLMLERDFDKITISQITDAAGVIRPSFYYHFQDKYDVLEYILVRDVISPVLERRREGSAALREAFRKMEEGRDFYRRAFRVRGQNGFEEMIVRRFYEAWLEALDDYKVVPLSNRLLNKNTIAMYYALGLANIIRLWIEDHHADADAEELYQAYEFLISHSIFDVVRDQYASPAGRPEGSL